MVNTYTIPECKREKLEKLTARYQKKAATYGIPLTVNFGEPYAKEYAIMGYDKINHCICDTHRRITVEVFDLTIDSEIIKKDGYEVVARIEHADEGNIVYTFGETEMQTKWAKMKAHCDHCNGNHNQKVTFIVRKDGSDKQVGSTCLKDYCGINPQGAGIANALNEIIEDDCCDREGYDFDGEGIYGVDNTLEVLAIAAKIQRERGYRSSQEPDSNKDMVRNMVHKGERADNPVDLATAERIAKVVSEMTIEDAIAARLDNVKTLVACGYCKSVHFGYLAYAPLALERYEKRMAELKAREDQKNGERASSEYVGEIGQKMVVDVSDFRLLTSWETQYGWTYLYKIIDNDNNVLIWKASKRFGENRPGERTKEGWYTEQWHDYQPTKLQVSVKDHNVRDGVKQTIVTRCKLVA